jgi:O-succinylbenzoate synthase
MRIDEASLFAVQNRLIVPFAASSHATQELTHILVRLRSDGVVGWGECATLEDPYYLGETTRTAWHVLKDFLLPSVMGRDFDDIDSFLALWGPVKGNTFAKAGLEMAAWDLVGRASHRAVADLLGGERDEILSGVSLGIERDIGRLLELIEMHLASGYRRVKLKVAKGRDVAVLEKVRERFPDVPLMVDANSAYTLDDLEHLRAFDSFGLTMIEQPLAWDDYVDHATLQRALKTPICLDESVRSAAAARQAIELGSCRVLNIKVARVGGLREAKRIHDECARRGVPVWCGGMHDFGVGRAANVALSTLHGFSIPGDISGFDKYFVEDIVEPPIVAHRGAIRPSRAPGLGHDVIEARVLGRTCAAERFVP